MSNLLSAQFSRLFKSKMFYAAVIILVLEGILSDFGNIMNLALDSEIFEKAEDTDTLENLYTMSMQIDVVCYYDFYIFIIIGAIFIGLFIGRDFEDNTIRNKIIVGYSRTAIYFSNLIVCVSAQIIMHLAYCLTIFIPSCIAYFKYTSSVYNPSFFENSVGDFLLCQLIGFGIILASSSIYLILTMISGSRTRGIIGSMLALFAMILLAQHAEGVIYNPEEQTNFYEYYSFDETADSAPPVYNPYNGYDSQTDFWESSRGRNVGKLDMLIYGTLDNILPTSQASYLLNSDRLPPRTLKYLLSDFCSSAVLNAAGIILFLRKEVR